MLWCITHGSTSFQGLCDILRRYGDLQNTQRATVEVEDDQRSPEIIVARSRVSSQDAMSSKSKKRWLAKDDELGNVISQSFDNISNAIDRAIEVIAKCFSKSYGAEVHAALGVLDLDPISKTEAYIFLKENPTYKEMFFGCSDHERKYVLLTLMSRP